MILIQKNQIAIVNHHLIKRVMDVKNGIKNMIHGVTQLTMIHHVVLKLQKIEDILIVAHFLKIKLKQIKLKKQLMIN